MREFKMNIYVVSGVIIHNGFFGKKYSTASFKIYARNGDEAIGKFISDCSEIKINIDINTICAIMVTMDDFNKIKEFENERK